MSVSGQRNSTKGAEDDNKQRWSAPTDQQYESYECERKIAGRSNGVDPQKAVERGTEHSNDCRVDPSHDGLCTDAPPEGVPERYRAQEDQKAGQKDAGNSQCRPCNPMRRGFAHGPKIRGECEQGPRHGLRGAVACKEGVLAHPAGGHECLAQQRQHDMAAAKYQCSGSVESVEQCDPLRSRTEDWRHGEEAKE